MAILWAILGLGVLIMVHELGHMLVARGFGMRVDRFSLGFGPVLLRWRGKKTTYQLALVPLGGFVQIAGMNPHEELEPDDPGSYANKPAHARFATILAGPLTNYLLSIVIMTGVILALGMPHWGHVIIGVAKGSPAEKGGLRAGDIIETIDRANVDSVTEAIAAISASKGQALQVKVLRGSQHSTLQVTPKKEKDTYRIGIEFGRKLSFSAVGVGGAIALGFYFPIDQTAIALASFKQWFTSRETAGRVGGPVEIVRQLSMSFEESLTMALIFLAILSVYLGFFNLMPIPALDGGRLIFLLFTMITRRPVNQRIENMVHMVGFILLLSLLALVSFGDISHLIKGR